MSSNLKRLLVAVDGSDYSLETVRYVANLFPPESMEVVLFNVMSKVPESYRDIEASPFFNPELLRAKVWAAQQEKIMKEFLEKARVVLSKNQVPEKAVTVRIEELKEGVARDILAESKQGYDAVVVGRRGLNPVSGLIMGSVSNKLVGKVTHVPIAVVGAASLSKKIILAIDSSEGAMRAVDYVGRMFSDSDVKVAMIHVMRGFDFMNPELVQELIPIFQAEIEADLKRAEEAIKTTFKNATANLENAGIDRSRITQEMVAGVNSRSESIVSMATEYGYGTIVLGRTGISKVEQFLMGRVSQKVIQLAKTAAVWVVN
ncbi:MAG: universal stress protein [Deltaproteobacteria bacterium]|nr:universal stress protein [Deltaproteobacteria bacterium]